MEAEDRGPQVSAYFATKKPSDIRMGSIKFTEREDNVELINGAIGNVSLPMHPKMVERLKSLGQPDGGFADGVVKYENTEGNLETQAAFLNILKQEGFDVSNLEVLITDGGSLAMEIAMLGICGEPGSDEHPLLMFDPTFTNYNAIAERLGRKTVTITRELNEEGYFTFPDIEVIEEVILKEKPNGILMIPYDNPTGQMYDYEIVYAIAELCVKHNLWLLSDEAYRGLFYNENRELVSIWGVTDEQVPGIEGRRISIETTSKIWNACGLRIGAIITDNPAFHQQAVAEYTSNLSANSIGQYIFGAIAHESKEELTLWMESARAYYREINQKMHQKLREENPNFIVSQPEASIYLVVDLKKVVKPGFQASDFITYCAEKGSVLVDGVPTTLLVSAMNGFYKGENEKINLADTQIRISFCEPAHKLKQIPYVFNELLKQFEEQRS